MLENRTCRSRLLTVLCLTLWLLQFTHTLRWGLSSAIPKSIINHQSVLLIDSQKFQLVLPAKDNTTQYNTVDHYIIFATIIFSRPFEFRLVEILQFSSPQPSWEIQLTPNWKPPRLDSASGRSHAHGHTWSCRTLRQMKSLHLSLAGAGGFVARQKGGHVWNGVQTPWFFCIAFVGEWSSHSLIGNP